MQAPKDVGGFFPRHHFSSLVLPGCCSAGRMRAVIWDLELSDNSKHNDQLEGTPLLPLFQPQVVFLWNNLQSKQLKG